MLNEHTFIRCNKNDRERFKEQAKREGVPMVVLLRVMLEDRKRMTENNIKYFQALYGNPQQEMPI